MRDTALSLPLSIRQVGDGNKLSAKAECTGCRAAQPFRWLFEREGGTLGGTRGSWYVKYVGSIRLGCGALRGSRFIGRLDGMDTDGTVKEGGSQDIRVARAPFDLECPVFGRGKLLVKLAKQSPQYIYTSPRQ